MWNTILIPYNSHLSNTKLTFVPSKKFSYQGKIDNNQHTVNLKSNRSCGNSNCGMKVC